MIAEIDIHVLIKFHINSTACDILWIALLYISIILYSVYLRFIIQFKSVNYSY